MCLRMFLFVPAVLNFVGGRNIIAPSERASVPQATGMCESQGMELMNLNSLTQMSSVQSFLGDIGKKNLFYFAPIDMVI
jgi:hypothetical protein